VAGARNVISGNNSSGVGIDFACSTGNQVEGNFIGTDVTGKVSLNNLNDGIVIVLAPNNVIGGAETGAGNLISGNRVNGIKIVGSTTTKNQVQGNRIGTDVRGQTGLGNRQNGIAIESAPGNLLGAHGAGNLISANLSDGIHISGVGASGNHVQSNLIGLRLDGTARLGNAASGVVIDGAPNNFIGGPTPAPATSSRGTSPSGY
jgi:hypothetical protein